MAEFDPAFKRLMELEGGYIDRADDPETKYGITVESWAAFRAKHPALPWVRDITEDMASAYYQLEWWEKGCYGKIADQRLATLYFCSAVNMGEKEATELLQRSANTLQYPRYLYPLSVDGECGPETIKAVNSLDAVDLAYDYAFKLKSRYVSLNKPQFEKGWLNRVDRAMEA